MSAAINFTAPAEARECKEEQEHDAQDGGRRRGRERTSTQETNTDTYQVSVYYPEVGATGKALYA